LKRKQQPDGRTQQEPKPVFDRVPPQSIDAERAVLGAMLLNPDAVGAALEVFRDAGADAFYVEAHQQIYGSLLTLFHKNVPVDPVTVYEQLNVDGHLETSGGGAYISELMGAVPTSANVAYYAQIVLDAAIRRKLISSCTTIAGTAYDGEGEVAELLDHAESAIFAISQTRQSNPIYKIGDLLSDSVAQIERLIHEHTGVMGLPTGFDDLDKILSGLQSSDMIVLAARPSVGKTALALNIARNVGVHDHKGVLLFSLEMAKEQLTQRLLCMEGRIDSARLRSGFLAKEEMSKLQPAAGRLYGAPIFIDETPNINILELRSKARRHMAQHDIKLVIIDYMQLMSGGMSRRVESRQVEISEISRGIKGLARELRVPVMALSQLSREAEKDDAGRPKLSHLRESGSIEQDADVVMILWRPPETKVQQHDNRIKLIVAKHRNGPTGTIDMAFLKNFQRFEEVERTERGEAPVGEEDYVGDDDEIPF
jgi:replicative DNA helicase